MLGLTVDWRSLKWQGRGVFSLFFQLKVELICERTPSAVSNVQTR